MQHRTITALFNTNADAERAADALAMKVGGVRATVCTASGDRSAMEAMNLGAEDRAGFDEAMRRGQVMVVARVPDGRFDEIASVLESSGALDMDEQEARWRREGWTGAPDGTRDNPPGTMASRGLDKVAGTNLSGAHPENARTAGMTSAPGTMGRDEAIPVVEERLRVGKREVEHGRVRIRSYVVETPVEEQVTLHQEHVAVERHPVDRAATEGDRLFQDRTIEARESTEEAVVSKEARVTEEVRLRKASEDRTETVRDTVRRTEVEVEDERGSMAGKSGTASGGTSTPGSTAKPAGRGTTRSGSDRS